jgi:hypothetical protein
MSAPAIIQATYADMKLVRTRSCAQLVFEIPIEQATAAIDAFGVPLPGKEVWCAIARLVPGEPPAPATPAQAEKPRQKWENLPLPQQAAMRCGEAPFRKFLVERYDALDSEESAAECVREMCGVKSRADIGKSEYSRRQWQEVDRDYQFWLRNA